MDKSVEHILLRLLTPAVLLFFASHLAAGGLDIRAEREQAVHRGSSTLYLEAGSGAARVKRPSRLQLRKSRACEEQRSCEGPRLVEAAAFVAVLRAVADTWGASLAHAFCRDDIVASLFVHARTQNPRDPPLVI
jgi:hypothetical protein